MVDFSVSLVIVNYNSKEFLRKCLKSIYENTHKISFEVFVVDNNSKDESTKMVKKEFPQVNLIKNEINVGFAKANNQAIRKSGGRYILLLNSDTLVLPNSLNMMKSFMDHHPQAGALGCKLLNPDMTLQPSCREFPGFITLLFESTFLDQLFPSNKIIGRYNLSSWDHNRIREVDQPMGACLMVRKKIIDEIGLLDEGFHMFFEEVDWCYRIKKRGWKIYFLPKARVIHYGGQSIRKANFKMFLSWHKSRYRFFRKRYSEVSPLVLRTILVGCSFLQPIIILIALYGIWRLVMYGILLF